MQIIHTVAALRKALEHQSQVGFVPTMGNLHDGHIRLVALAKQHASCVVVSIFVNPLQFGAHEDFSSYPRTLEADCQKLEAAGADIVFAPEVHEMYPDFDGRQLNQSMTISPPPLASAWCGATRPDHFSGVATVVMKLFNIVQPNIAVFGKKDYQQLLVIKEMVKQFNLSIEMVAAETMREDSGLAMSSRNGYVSPEQKAIAPQLHQVIRHIVHQVRQGDHHFSVLERCAAEQLTRQGWVVDYISICSADSLTPATEVDKHLVVLAAAKLGKTRLIDNIDFMR